MAEEKIHTVTNDDKKSAIEVSESDL